jgi:hypothetical protein
MIYTVVLMKTIIIMVVTTIYKDPSITTKNVYYVYKKLLLTSCFGLNRPLSGNA